MIDDSLAAWLMHDLPDPHDGVKRRRPSWHAPQAACKGAGVDMFITDPGALQSPLRPFLCAGCTVPVYSCLAYALTDPQLVGVWGGTPPIRPDIADLPHNFVTPTSLSSTCPSHESTTCQPLAVAVPSPPPDRLRAARRPAAAV